MPERSTKFTRKSGNIRTEGCAPMEHLTNLFLIVLFVLAVVGIDVLLERYGQASFLTRGSLTALIGGGAAGWFGLGMVQNTLPFGSTTIGIGLLALAPVAWTGLLVRNFKVAAKPAVALAGTALQAGVGYAAGPSLFVIAVLIVAVVCAQIFLRALPPMQHVVPVVNGKPHY